MTTKLWLFVFLLLSLFIWDGFNRLQLPQDTLSDVSGKILPKVPLPQKFGQQTQTRIAELYAIYNPNETKQVEIESIGLTDEQQRQQNGLLDELFAGNQRIRLTAVIKQAKQPIYALVTLQNVTNEEHELKKLQMDSRLMGYQVIDLNLNRLKLQSVDEPERVISLPIYGTSVNSPSNKEIKE